MRRVTPRGYWRIGAADAGIAAVVFFHHAAAIGAGVGQGGVVARNGVAVVLFGFAHHALGHVGNFQHEGLARQLPALHQGQLVFPLAGQFGARKLFDSQATQQRHELKSLGCGNQLAAFTQHVLFGQQAFNDARARGWRAQPLVLHGFAQLFVFNGLARTFHSAQQGGLGVACGGACFQGFGLHGLVEHGFTGLHRHQRFARFFARGYFLVGFFAINGQPARLDQHLALAFEGMSRSGRLHRGDAGGDLVFRTWKKHRHKAAHHQGVKLVLGLAQAAGRLQRGDDGKVVADLGVVKNALAGLDIALVQGGQGVRRQVVHARIGQHFKGLLDHRHVVLGQMARVGSGVGQGLVLFVQALRQRQRGFGRIPKLAVGLALQAGQVKQGGRGLSGGLALFAHRARLTLHRMGNGLGFGGVPESVGTQLGIRMAVWP